MSGRFGFDPRSSARCDQCGLFLERSQLPVDTYPYAELLVTFGAGAFFPSRCGRTGDLTSARGRRGRGESRAGFAYHLWPSPLPVIARSAGCQSPRGHTRRTAPACKAGHAQKLLQFPFS